MTRLIICLALCALPLSWAHADHSSVEQAALRLLSDKCFRCHGPDAATREAGLRLDRAEAARVELDSGMQAIVPGNVDESELIVRITSEDEDLRMPPADLGPALQPEEIALLKKWIAAGATYRQHWALTPIQRPDLRDLPPASSMVDRFLNKELQAQGLTANPPAARESLLRRVSLALTGLPPSLAEQEAFRRDRQSDAYPRLVERLLASPRAGERWARVWLDMARYADSAGYAQDPARTIWRYRDWVIQAYNRNLPFDQFTVEQLAGDQLDDPQEPQLLATAFHRNTMTNSEGGTDDEEFRHAAVVDRVNTTMQVWLGITMGCAQCHDHKYDDLSQEEYYRVFAVFNNTQDADRGDEFPWLEELTEEQQKQKVTLEKQLAAKPDDEEQRKALEKQLKGIRGVRTPIMRELAANKQRQTFVSVRGNFRQRAQQVQAGVPAAISPAQSVTSRLDLARWLTSPQNPLTARVFVNRYWELLFGRGLVTTSEDFGVQGEPPSHPELLDYLASELIHRQWDTNWLLRELVLSEAYQRSSAVTPELEQADLPNRWYARGPRFRLPAEMIRDQALELSGLLSTKIGGPSVRPPRPKLGLRAAFGGSTDWEPSRGEDRYRRGIYTSWRRTTPYPSMTTFDAPSREFCTIRRIRTNTPLQALVTLNDPVFVEAAQQLARQILRVGGDAFADQVHYAYQRVLARPPRSAEVDRLGALAQQIEARFAKDLPAAEAMAGGSTGEPVLDVATWTVISNVLLNLDETLAPR